MGLERVNFMFPFPLSLNKHGWSAHWVPGWDNVGRVCRRVCGEQRQFYVGWTVGRDSQADPTADREGVSRMSAKAPGKG